MLSSFLLFCNCSLHTVTFTFCHCSYAETEVFLFYASFLKPLATPTIPHVIIYHKNLPVPPEGISWQSLPQVMIRCSLPGSFSHASSFSLWLSCPELKFLSTPCRCFPVLYLTVLSERVSLYPGHPFSSQIYLQFLQTAATDVHMLPG